MNEMTQKIPEEAPPTLPEPRNLLQRLNAVRAAVHYVRKDKRVGEGGYLAVTHDAVTALTREAFIREGVLIVPSLIASTVVATGTTTAKGVPFIRYEARFRFSVMNVDIPTECIQFELEAHALDQGDKAPGKAISYAKKYAVLKLLEIESGEDEETRENQRPGITPSAGARDNVEPERLEFCEDLASTIVDLLNADMIDKAAHKFYEAELATEERVFVWTFFNSKQKTAMKKVWDEFKKASGK
jgi:hypothetical protein